MATLIQAYEQQYSVLTAELTSKIGRLKVGNKDDCDQLVKEIDANFEEANDLLEQLDLECHGFGANAASTRAAAYRAELQRMKKEYNSLGTSDNDDHYNQDTDDVYDDWSTNEQHQKLLGQSTKTTNQKSKSRRALEEGYRIAMETEQIGANVLQDLSGQRETINRARERLRDTDGALSRSTRVMHAMVSRALQQRLAIMAMVFATGVILCASLYLYLT